MIKPCWQARKLERKQSKTSTSIAHRGEHWRYILDLARAVVQELQDKPEQPKPMRHRDTTMYSFLDIT